MVELRDYQIPAVSTLAQTFRGILKSPAGSGKTIIGAAALARWSKVRSKLQRRKMRVAWIAHSTDQLEQAKRAVALFPVIAESCDLTMACYAACLPLASYDLAILDECHHIAAPEFRKALNFHEGARWGLSATPERADDLKDDVFRLIGPIVHTISRQLLVNSGQLAQAKVIFHAPNKPKEFEEVIAKAALPLYEERKRRWPVFFKNKHAAEHQMSKCVWQAAQGIAITENTARNQRIIDIALSHPHDSHLIIVGSVAHGEAIQAHIPGAIICHSRIGPKRRREAIAAFSNGVAKCMIATSLADEGLDVPRASILTLAAAGRSAAKAEQRTGRVLRAFHDKTHGTIHDFWDHQHYFLLHHSKRRKQLYTSLNYSISFQS